MVLEIAILDHFRRPYPGVPIEPRRCRLRTVLAKIAAHLIRHATSHIELADHAFLQFSDAFHNIRAGSVLRADLDHAAVLSCSLDHFAAFPNVVRGGFFHVHVLTCLTSPDRLQGVPMVLRGETDRINRLIVE